MTTPQKSFWSAEKIFLAALCAAFVWHRAALDPLQVVESLLRRVVPTIPVVVPVRPTVDVSSLTPAQRAFYDTLARVDADDRDTLGRFYAGLARSLAADPTSDPVINSVDEIRRAHRAGLLFIYRGLAGNQPNKYPSLDADIAACLTEAIGDKSVPLNPSLRKAAVDCFSRMADLCNVKR